MSEDKQRDARSAYGGALQYYEADLRKIRELTVERNQLMRKVNERWQQLWEWAGTGGLHCVEPPGRQDLGDVVAPDERPRINFAAMQAEAEARALARQTPEMRERIERQKQREKENEARVARSFPKMAGSGPVSIPSL